MTSKTFSGQNTTAIILLGIAAPCWRKVALLGTAFVPFTGIIIDDCAAVGTKMRRAATVMN